MGERTTVHFLRHGEVHNPDLVLYGRLPGFRLSEDGLQMAKDAADALKDRDVVVFVDEAHRTQFGKFGTWMQGCLLYTSDAADE